MTYKSLHYDRQISVLNAHPDFFGNDKGGGSFKGKKYPFVLEKGVHNLFEPIRSSACQYFRDNNISWWGGHAPTGHMLSSQIACLNHLFAIREDADAVLALINNIRPDLHFEKVLPLAIDKDRKYIAFEAVSAIDHLNEGEPTRGANCTSVDALIAAETANGDVWLLPIEWKYTESYPPTDKSGEARKGEIRLGRYSDLLRNSEYLRKYDSYAHTPYFFEPFYQLMRQTLWAEQMILHKDSEWIKADHFLHLHVIPSGNASLLNKKYRCTGKDMEESWHDHLLSDSYQIITPEKLLYPLQETGRYSKLMEYLGVRYW